MRPFPISFDVTDSLPVDITGDKTLNIATWLFFPDDIKKLGDNPVVMTLLHGGSYDKRYFHFEIPGYSDYSAAQYLASLGNIVLVPDLLGVGESSKAVDQKKATRQIVALAIHAAMTQMYQRLSAGELPEELPPLKDFVKIGVGHSMGGMQMITQQAEYTTYDGVMILGFTTIGVHFTVNGKQIRVDSQPSNVPPGDYTMGGRERMHETFHWDDVPQEIIAFDDSLAVPTPSTIGLISLNGSLIAADATRIDVPVYIGMGERDVSPDPHAEVLNYKRSADITLYILPRSGHCHNFASTRRELWTRMHRWAHGVNK